MSVSSQSNFAKNIRDIFEKFNPKKIIETGTYNGMGTTAILASCIQELGFDSTQFYSIEVNPAFHENAKKNLKTCGLLEYVELLNGLSLFRNQLPTGESIQRKFVMGHWPQEIYIDHSPNNRVQKYLQETDFPSVPDGLLIKCLQKFNFVPDFVLLDSGGHVGEEEFSLLISSVKGPCLIALDDVYHVKHYNNFNRMKNNSKFKILRGSAEKFGHCIAYYSP